MRNIIDTSEIIEFAESLNDNTRQMKRLEKKMLREQGTKLRRKTAQRARASVKKTAVHRRRYERAAGQYHKSIKRGKAYDKSGALQIRVYSNDPIAHLIEDGYTPKLRDGTSGTHQPGKKVFEKAREHFEPEFHAAIENFVDEVMRIYDYVAADR